MNVDDSGQALQEMIASIGFMSYFLVELIHKHTAN